MIKTVETAEIRSSLCTFEEKTVRRQLLLLLLLLLSSRLCISICAEGSRSGEPYFRGAGVEPDEEGWSLQVASETVSGFPYLAIHTNDCEEKTKIKNNQQIRAAGLCMDKKLA